MCGGSACTVRREGRRKPSLPLWLLAINWSVMKKSNKSVYSTVEFDNWANRDGLIPSESFLIEKFLEPDRTTLEAGTATGRILLELQRRGYTKLSGFDYIPGFIDRAKFRDTSGKIDYAVMDARHTKYPNDKFDQIIYLQQIISCIETDEGRLQAIRDAFRILKSEGVALLSFLCFESRMADPFYRILLGWIRFIRTLVNNKTSIQYLPWFKQAGCWNWKSLLDVGPYVYWYRASEIEEMLTRAGFRIVAVGTAKHIAMNSMRPTVQQLNKGWTLGHIYFVCYK